MKFYAFAAFLAILVLSAASAESIESGKYFSVPSGERYTCFYINLPQDLDVNSVGSAVQAEIMSDKEKSPWVDTTSVFVKVNPGMLTRQPICFYHENKNDGDYSFFEINISSKELSREKTIEGGVCVTSYADVDSGTETNVTDVCSLLSKSADIFDVQFRYPYMEARPGEIIRNMVYVTSYAKVRMKFFVETDLKTTLDEWTVATSSSNPSFSKGFDIRAPSAEGDYFVIVRGSIMGCRLESCKKTAIARIKVEKNVTRKGFSLNVVPKNLNIKNAQNITLKLLITNYENEMNFSISVLTKPKVLIIPEKAEIEISKNSFKSKEFTLSLPSKENTLYKIRFDVISNSGEEHTTTAYISVGELLTDAKREVESILRKAKSKGDKKTETFVLKKLEEWEEMRRETDYGEELASYEEFKKAIEEAKKGRIKNEDNKKEEVFKDKGDGYESYEEEKNNENGMLDIILIIIIIGAAVGIIVFVLIKKSKNVSETYEYPQFDDESF